MQFFAIVLVSVAAASVYGVIHDQFTIRVCLEYFTVGHPPIFSTSSPTLLALGWGIIATWWVGLLLGIPLAAVARLGRAHPPISVRELVPAIGLLLVVMSCCALVAGFLGYSAGQRGDVSPPPWLGAHLPLEFRARFVATSWAHLASYMSGIVGGVILIAVTRIRRARSRWPATA